MNDLMLNGREIYKDDIVKICVSPCGEGHDMPIRNEYVSLPRGTLMELSMSNPKNIERMYDNIRSQITGLSLKQLNISPAEFGWILSKARNNDLEYMLYSR